MPPETIHPFILRHPASAALHLAYAVWALYAAGLLWRLARGPVQRAGVACFGVSMVLLYAVSGLYHAIPADRPGLVEFFRLLDLSLIHVLIAGTCTPVVLLLPAKWRSAALSLVWGVAAVGVLSKWLLPLPPYPLTVGLYAAAGALGLLPLFAVSSRLDSRTRFWLLGGAAVYAVGGACESARWPTLWPGVIGPHEILHGCDVVGSTLHLVFVMRWLDPGLDSRGDRRYPVDRAGRDATGTVLADEPLRMTPRDSSPACPHE